MAPTAVLAARYMTRFRCLGGDCEATCCGGGTIPVDESNHRRLAVLADGDAAASSLLERGIEQTVDGSRIRFDEAGECSFRDGAGLCRIHQRFGHEALFDVCATFPRYASQVDDDIELFGTLACPEVARLALLSDDAFELTHFTLEEPPRLLRNRFRTEPPYFRPFKAVRAALVALVSEPNYELSEKLFVALWIADKLKGVLRRGAESVSPIELERALAALTEPEVLVSLTRSFQGLSLDGGLALSVVASLRPPPEPRRGAQTAGFDAIWQGVVAHYGPSFAPGVTATEGELKSAWAEYMRLGAALPIETAALVDGRLARYVVNHVLTTPYMLSDSVFEFAYDLVVRTACLRFLLTTVLAARNVAGAELDAEIVRVTFSYVRAVEHTDAPSALQRALREQGMGGLAHAVALLALWRTKP